MYNIQNIVAKNILNYRKKHQLSLDKLATMTGVSKNMLSQIEKGASNPTITTLWKIANGLHLSLSQLTAVNDESIDFIDESDIIPIIEDQVAIYPYFPYDDQKKFEMFKMQIEPGGKMISEPHHPESEEYIIVSAGQLEIAINSEKYTINSNQAFRFKSDVTHTYFNPLDKTVVFTATIYYQ
ncbi:XRE family transcriptional regulator [Staphylococcus succinus]|uniref:XRE family transcriptional regulator n=2 Tax=Staphylococcus succinus TaxID=61015 RepID=A0A9Q6HR49_9STAP|nr:MULTISPECIES: XRE family transcriptional regulator [Staphylococcus]MBU0438571.1 XRE family transcriptional regulator [Staphylococcus succinus]MDH9161648.1 XRE family transcriptional regulator [Staphylococcus succinus]MEB7462813.1 XRE family transcriptional regulator [Staphylococcus succinus]MEB8123663.1 XRE family transcriptional regulator [Staphylococcus succinus]MEB8210277.1 XRE family transcriptional regulator [Staphylococcus succinus]